ncbi:DUF294 nucleotidyltransferase-like domain-containing protein [Ectopseudomonas mendocina]|uniref:DUF294 nucleotidyltransferase-like domain-containing protein n=1 Tax=Ectopseudomonas mendocina TaxID=300 RepID=A0ABZ2RFI9_ECTME
MQIEIVEIRDHLARFPPFDSLPEDTLNSIATQVEVAYFKAGTEILEYGAAIHDLHYLRSGAVEIYRRSGELYNRLSEGDIFGQVGLLRSNKVRFPATAIEDSLVYFIPEATFTQLCEEHDGFAEFVEADGQSRLKSAVKNQNKGSDLTQLKVQSLITRPAVSVAQDTPIQQAAQVMTEQSVSSLVITDTEDDSASMVGILTDRDLRTRVLAAGLSGQTPVSDVMTPDPITLRSSDSVFSAMLCMLRNNIHHLPILHQQRTVGLLNLSDIIRYESQNSLYLVNAIFNQTSVEGLQSLLPELRGSFVRMTNELATAHMIGSAMSSIGRAFTQRLLELAEQQYGPPPVSYCFMVAGSMARDEQLILTDQDNALVLSDRYDPALHGEYFSQLATFVCDGLAACGYSYCKGGIMASNPQWRQPLRVWRELFTQWIEQPNAKALLNSSIFFDLDGVYGKTALVENLKDLLANKASQSPAFLAAMARNALNRTPPLGIFRTFVMETDGRQKHLINLKGRGTAPLTDLIRVHALACGSRAQNSLERIDDISKTKLLQPEALEQLRYALEYLSMVRIRHQARDVSEGREPDNYIEPENVSAADRHNLKEAFQVLNRAQKFIRFRYPANAGK